MAIKDRIFGLKDAYIFKAKEGRSIEDYLLEELIFQLKNLEGLWLEVSSQGPPKKLVTLQYRLQLEKLLFRLNEVLRFIKQNQGPKIIEFVCSEIYDLVYEKIVMEAIFSQNELNQVSVILTVMNTYFQPEVFILQIVDIETISQELKQAVDSLLKRLEK